MANRRETQRATIKTVHKTVARQLVEGAGIDVEKLLDLLVRNASAELTTCYCYTILRVNLIGLARRNRGRRSAAPSIG